MKNLITSLSFFVILSSLSIGYSQVVVSATRMNVLYRGIENPLEFAVSGWDNKDLSISVSDDHKLTHQEDGSFIITPSSNSRQATISVEGKMPDGSISDLGSTEFRIKRIPDPVAMWSGKKASDRTINIREILAFNPLDAQMENFDFVVILPVQSFTLQIVGVNGTYNEEKSTSKRFTEEMEIMLSRVEREYTIYFQDIVVSMPDGKDRPIAGMKFVVE